MKVVYMAKGSLLYLPVYNVHFFLANFTSKIKMPHYTQNLLFSYEVIWIHVTQKIQDRTTPNSLKQGEINQDEKFV